MTLLMGCSPGTFRIDKDGMTTHFGRQDSTLSRSLCTSGDLREILMDASITQQAKHDFFQYLCREKASRGKIVQLYRQLSREEQRELKRAFVLHGYEVNRPDC